MKNKLKEGSRSTTGYAVTRYNPFNDLVDITRFYDDRDAAIAFWEIYGGFVVEFTESISWKEVE